ncbi:MAG: hypothetical protein ABI855_10310 [Bacteroidota bacterium]
MIKPNARFNSSHQNMMSAVITYCLSAANLATTSLIAAFLAVINLIKTNLEAIIALEGQTNSTVNGVAEQKKIAKNSLVQTTALIMQTVYAFALKNGLTELKAKMQISPSQLKKMKDKTLIGTVTGAIESVTGVLGQLTTYNITQEVVDLWSDNLESFSSIVSNPKVAHDGIDVLKNRTQDYLRENMDLLYNQADTIALQYKQNNLSYYRGFKKARKLIPLVKHTKLRVLVTTPLGVPVSHVRCQQDHSTNYVITDINGRADLYIQIQTGATELKSVYTFTLSKDTLRMTTPEFVIKKGRTRTENFVMNVDGFIIPETEITFAETEN